MSLHISRNSAPIFLYFNRTGSTSTNVFDHITITKKNDFYHVVYKSDVGSDTFGSKLEFEAYDKDALLGYFSNVFALLEKDQMPFYSIDVLIPCFPSVKFGHAILAEITPLVLNCIRMWV
jgi:hypothetical protein